MEFHYATLDFLYAQFFLNMYDLFLEAKMAMGKLQHIKIKSLLSSVCSIINFIIKSFVNLVNFIIKSFVNLVNLITMKLIYTN